jgi:LmbE family N-acetylglucosaminyl deacetylase
LIKTLHATSRQVAQLLGVEALFFYSLPDNRFDTLPLLDLVKIIEELIARLEPEVIYTHHGGDLNIDHMVTHRAVLTATRPVGGCPVRELYAFEVPSSTEWTFGQLQPSFRPNVFMDISDTLEAKMQAMALYESEVRPFPHPSSPDAIRAIARRWGSTAGVEAAEAFELVRATR